MNISKMSDEGATQTIGEICDGLKRFIGHNPRKAKEILVVLVPDLEMLAEDDFFGTEGWGHAFGMEE